MSHSGAPRKNRAARDAALKRRSEAVREALGMGPPPVSEPDPEPEPEPEKPVKQKISEKPNE